MTKLEQARADFIQAGIDFAKDTDNLDQVGTKLSLARTKFTQAKIEFYQAKNYKSQKVRDKFFQAEADKKQAWDNYDQANSERYKSWDKYIQARDTLLKLEIEHILTTNINI